MIPFSAAANQTLTLAPLDFLLVAGSTMQVGSTGSNNPFTGGTWVNEGTLVVNGSLSFGLGNVQVLPTGTLSGTGVVGGITLAGNTLQFTVTTVPEPGTWALLLVAGLLAATRLRRRVTAG
jgi:hypothetical protein